MNTAKTILFRAAALLAVILFPANAAEYFTETVDGLEWTYRIEDGGAVLESGEEETPAVAGDIPSDLVIPARLGGRPVTVLGAYACYDLWELESVDIPDSVTSIGNDAFDYSGLRTIDLPAGLKTIGEHAFCCERLGEGADYVLVIPDGVTDIGKGAFAWCEEVVRVVLPASVTNIGAEVFYECSALDAIDVDASNPAYRWDDGVLYSKDCKTIVCVLPSLSGAFSISGSVTRIAPSAFASCHDLTSVAIPEGVTDIGAFAFGDCALTTVSIPASVTNIGWGAFICYSDDPGKPSLKSVKVASGNPAYAAVGGVLFTKDRKTLVCVPDGMTGQYAIPAGVTRIGGYAFNTCESLTGITIPDTVTEIEEGAFSGGCYSLTELTIPDSVTNIGSFAFTDCESLASLTLPAACRMEIGENTFEGCVSLGSITLPYGVTNIGKEAFRFCTNLTAVVIPDTVLSIGRRAFAECSSLETLAIPASVTSVGKDAFTECDALKRLSVPTAWKGTDMLERAAVPAGCAIVYEDGPSLVLPAAGEIFPAEGASGQEMKVTANVRWTAESSATWLTVKTASGSGNGTIMYDVASNEGAEERTGTITVRGAGITRSFTVTQSGAGITWFYVITDGKATVTGSEPVAAGNLTIPSSLGGCPVTDIGQSAFSACTGLTSVTIPDSVTNIGTWAFSNWSSPLESVQIGNGVQTIGEGAFEGCGALTSVTFGNSVRTIENEAFSLCKGLVSVRLPDSVIRIGIGAFSDCGMTSMHIPAGVADIGVDAFFGCDNLTSFTVAAGNVHFSTTDGLLVSKNRKVLVCCPPGRSGAFSIPSGVAEIGQQAFDGCAKLTSVSIPDTVTNIGVGAFSCCYGLESVDIPDSVTRIGFAAFTECSSLRSLTIPDSVKNIEDSLFQSSGVSSVGIPNSVTNIGDSAFWNCRNLETLTIPASVERVGDWAFDGCNGLATLYVPASWQGTDMLASAGVPEGCRVVYDTPQAQLTLSAGERSFMASAADGQQLGVTANVPWMAGTSAPWLAVRTWSGSGNGTIVYDVAENTGTEARTGTITVTGGGITRTFTVVQDGKAPPAPGQPQKLTFDANGGRCDTAWDEYTIGGAYRYLPTAKWDEGVVFAGWYTRPDGGEPVTASDIVTTEEERTIHAHWRLVPTAACPVPVPCEWLAAHGLGGDRVQAYVEAAESVAANGMRVWECYVAGLDPTDAAAEFKAELVFEDGKWKAKPKGGEMAGRVYRVKGKKALEGTEEWQDVTDVEDADREGWRFLRVGVELEESEP